MLRFHRNNSERMILTGPAKAADAATYTEKPNTMYRLRLHSFSIMMRRPLLSPSGLSNIEKQLTAGQLSRYHFYKQVFL